MYVLDTNVVSALRRPERTDPAVRAWAAGEAAASFYLSVVTILEIEQGVLGIERRDLAQGEALRMWFEGQILAGYAQRILPIDTAVARRCARLHVPDRRGERDALIAATALVHGMAVVTRNVPDFEGTGVRIVDPWQPAAGGLS